MRRRSRSRRRRRKGRRRKGRRRTSFVGYKQQLPKELKERFGMVGVMKVEKEVGRD